MVFTTQQLAAAGKPLADTPQIKQGGGMRTIQADFAAAEAKRFEIAGRFLRIVAAVDNSLNIQWLKNGSIIGDALLVGSFFAVDAGVAGEDFDAFIITNPGAAQAGVKFSVSSWAVEAV